MSRTKRQHYVPQSYLRRFTHNGTHVFAFDKASGIVFESHVRNIAQQRYFLDLPAEIVRDEDPQVLEHILADMESHYATVVDDILNSLAKRGRFNKGHKTMMALFVTLQFLRTKEQRENLRQSRESVVEAINQTLAGDGYRLEFGYQSESANHFLQLFDPKILFPIISVLLEHIWVVWRNKTEHQFYTSDHPVVLASQLSQAVGFASPGVEVLLPLTSRYLLSICDKHHFSKLQYSDCRATNLFEDSRVAYYNENQVIRSHRQVYCSSDDFAIARDVCKRSPAVCDPDRTRIAVQEIGEHLIKFSRR